jgi:hypothetical protein
MSDYLLHGLRVNRDTARIDVNYQFDSLLPLTFGATHQNGISSMFPYFPVGPLDVTDVYLSATAGDIAGFDFTVKYTRRFLSFDKLNGADGSYGKIGIGVRRNLGFADFVVESAAGLNSRSSFFQRAAGTAGSTVPDSKRPSPSVTAHL